MKRIANYLHLLLFLIISSLFFLPYAYAQTFRLNEYEIKAAYIYNFAKFVEWPKESFADEQSPINICIFGHDPFGDAFQSIKEKTAQGRKVVITRTNSLQNLRKCNILFVNPNSEEQIPAIVELAIALSILTVSDFEKYAKYGVAINFYLQNNKVKFSINPDSAKRSKLSINSMLLDIAKKFHEER